MVGQRHLGLVRCSLTSFPTRQASLAKFALAFGSYDQLKVRWNKVYTPSFSLFFADFLLLFLITFFCWFFSDGKTVIKAMDGARIRSERARNLMGWRYCAEDDWNIGSVLCVCVYLFVQSEYVARRPKCQILSWPAMALLCSRDDWSWDRVTGNISSVPSAQYLV